MFDAGRLLALAVALTPAGLAVVLVRAISLPDRRSFVGRLTRIAAVLGIALLAAGSLLAVWTLWTTMGQVGGPGIGGPDGPLGPLGAFRLAAWLTLGGTGLLAGVLLASVLSAVAGPRRTGDERA